MKKIKIWLGHKLYRWEKTGGPGSETQTVLPCRASPARLIRAKNGPGQNGPGWPVLTPLHTTPCLNEDSHSTCTGFIATSLGRAILAREPVAQHKIWSPERDTQTQVGTSFCNFRLGKSNSLGQKWQSVIAGHTYKPSKPYQNITQSLPHIK